MITKLFCSSLRGTSHPPAILGALVSAITLILTQASLVQAEHQTADTKTPDSYEYKVLLANDKFSDRDKAIDAFLDRLEAITEKHDDVTWNGKKWENLSERTWEQREIRFLDTANRAIRKHALIFRTRVEMSDNCGQDSLSQCSPAEAKVTLKQRFSADADPAKKALFHIEPDTAKAAGFDGQVMETSNKFEKDFGWQAVGTGERQMVAKLSLSSDVKTADLSRGKLRAWSTLGEAMAVYPDVAWNGIKGQADDSLSPTCMIASTKVKVGKLIFNGDDKIKCKASFSFWRKQDDNSPLATEFSYTCKNKDVFTTANRDLARAVFKDLIMDEAVNSEPRTKTETAYDCKP